MIPLELTLENFYCHTKSVIDFTQFNAAVIVGQGTNNTRRSNGVGKSKIFTGINYALFNQTSSKLIEKIIRDGADKCRVTFIFQIEKDVFKVERARGRKANSVDLRLYRKKESDWEDLTAKTSSATEDALRKLIKINYQTFINSLYFKQSDLAGLALASPGDKKKILKEVLQLHVYSQLEKITKKRISDINEDVVKNKAILSTFEDLEIRKENLIKEISIKEKEKEFSESLILNDQVLINDLDLQISKFSEREKQLNDEYSLINQKILECQNIISGLKSAKEQSLHVRSDLKIEFQKKKSNLLDAHSKLKELQLKEIDSIDLLSSNLESIEKSILDKKTLIKNYQFKIKESSITLPEGPQCETCLQSIAEGHRASCQQKAEAKIKEYKVNINIISVELEDLLNRHKQLSSKIRTVEDLKREINSLTKDITTKEADLESIKKKYSSFESKIKEFDQKFSEKELEFDKWIHLKNEFESSKALEFKEIIEKVKPLKEQKNIKISALKEEQNKLNQISVSLGILKDRDAKYNQDLVKKKELSAKLIELEDSINLHYSVAQAFGSKGIPALIIHNMLDDLQIYANETVQRILPGLQLKFEIDKEDSKGEKTDTLDIKYQLNGRDREYEDLSGAQQLVVTLGLRLGLSLVIQKSLGIDIKFIMLDEVDASLDEENLDFFVDLVRSLEKDFKVLVITHNNSIKSKFKHAVLVEQDSDMNSTAKVISNW